MLIQLKKLGTLMGYPIGVFTWVVVKINGQTVFWQIWTGERTFNSFTNFPFTLLSIFVRVLLFKIFNLLIFNLFLIKFRSCKNNFFFFWKFEIFCISWYYKIEKFHKFNFVEDHIILQNKIIEKRTCHNWIKNNLKWNSSDFDTN